MDPVQLQTDIIETFHNATIQHGIFNNRIYLMKIGQANPAILLPQLIKLAQQNGYSKIFAKVPTAAQDIFINTGFRIEATVQKFYIGKADASFLGYYLDENRATIKNHEELRRVMELAIARQDCGKATDSDFTLRKCNENDVNRMAEIYSKVFPTYPFPIDSPDYLLETMRTHVRYFCAEIDERMVAVSSSEMDLSAMNVEMTDFATLPEYRGSGLANALLEFMETAMRHKSIHTAYTIARAISPGMNITFAKRGYKYCGRLTNNTNISGNIESMNVWAKNLALREK